jgi:hypothetical protein
VVLLLATSSAGAQGLGGRTMGGGGPGQQQHQAQPKGPTPEEEEEVHNAYVRASEPEIAPPTDPLGISPELRARIGSSLAGSPEEGPPRLRHRADP